MEPFQDTANITTRIKTWWYDRWEGRWKGFQQGLPERKTTPAAKGDLLNGRSDHHQGLRKVESSMATQMRTGKIGLNHFLWTRRVPGVTSASCPCGWRKQDVKHVLLFCPFYNERRPRLIRQAGTTDFFKILTIPEAIKAASRWMIDSGALGQYSLAQEQLLIDDRQSKKELEIEEKRKAKR